MWCYVSEGDKIFLESVRLKYVDKRLSQFWKEKCLLIIDIEILDDFKKDSFYVGILIGSQIKSYVGG